MERLLEAEQELLEPPAPDGRSALADTLRSLLLTFESDDPLTDV